MSTALPAGYSDPIRMGEATGGLPVEFCNEFDAAFDRCMRGYYILLLQF